jgi:hypothetical protein
MKKLMVNLFPEEKKMAKDFSVDICNDCLIVLGGQIAKEKEQKKRKCYFCKHLTFTKNFIVKIGEK